MFTKIQAKFSHKSLYPNIVWGYDNVVLSAFKFLTHDCKRTQEDTAKY
jgi:hypothetical protein